MSTSAHPTATHHLPAFIAGPGQTDGLLVFSGILLIAGVLAVGVFFLWLHSLPERMVHNKWQYDIVAVLCLLALFTHVHAFWVAALLLAFIKIPDFSVPDFQTPLQSIAGSLDKLAAADLRPPESAVATSTSTTLAAQKTAAVPPKLAGPTKKPVGGKK